MKNLVFTLSLIFLFAISAYSKSYTLRIVESEFSDLNFPKEVKAENVSLPYQLTPKQYENIDHSKVREFQISLPTDKNIVMLDTTYLQHKDKNWISEKSRELKVEKITDDRFTVKLKISQTCKAELAESETLADTDEDIQYFNPDFFAIASHVVSLNKPTLVYCAQIGKLTEDSTFILGDIPLLGYFFRSKNKSSSYMSIMLILTENDDEGVD